MRYMLYKADEKKVPLSREIEYIESYIDLQKLRFGDDVPIEVTFDIEDNQRVLNIEPMMLIPFAENAFKHGINIDDPFISCSAAIGITGTGIMAMAGIIVAFTMQIQR